MPPFAGPLPPRLGNTVLHKWSSIIMGEASMEVISFTGDSFFSHNEWRHWDKRWMKWCSIIYDSLPPFHRPQTEISEKSFSWLDEAMWLDYCPSIQMQEQKWFLVWIYPILPGIWKCKWCCVLLNPSIDSMTISSSLFFTHLVDLFVLFSF